MKTRSIVVSRKVRRFGLLLNIEFKQFENIDITDIITAIVVGIRVRKRRFILKRCRRETWFFLMFCNILISLNLHILISLSKFILRI